MEEHMLKKINHLIIIAKGILTNLSLQMHGHSLVTAIRNQEQESEKQHKEG